MCRIPARRVRLRQQPELVLCGGLIARLGETGDEALGELLRCHRPSFRRHSDFARVPLSRSDGASPMRLLALPTMLLSSALLIAAPAGAIEASIGLQTETSSLDPHFAIVG